jgi:membrane-bound lytic murein transglycosylase B
VKRPGDSVFGRVSEFVDLSSRKVVRVPVTKAVKFAVAAVALGFFMLGFATAPTNTSLAKSSQEERQELEAQLSELEKQIDQYEEQIVSYQKQEKNLTGEISGLNAKIAKLNLQIKAINLSLAQLDTKIADTRSDIKTTEESIDTNKQALAQLMRNVYVADRTSLLEIFLANPRLSDFFTDVNNIGVLQDNLRVTIGRITDLKTQLEDQHEQLSLARADTATLKEYQAAQKRETETAQKEKQTLLVAKKEEKKKVSELAQKTREEALKIRNRLFELLGGGEMTFQEAYDLAKIAAGATGIRPAFLLAVLDRESALGRNVGRCTYKTAMSPKDQVVFLELVKELNISPDSVTVSCPNADGIYGGAMGPAQFIPTTWQLYKNKISALTGRRPPSPWNNADAFSAAALYLKDAGAGSNERTAAARYYCGSRWNRYVCLNVYGRKVVEQANRFQKDIEVLTSANASAGQNGFVSLDTP